MPVEHQDQVKFSGLQISDLHSLNAGSISALKSGLPLLADGKIRFNFYHKMETTLRTDWFDAYHLFEYYFITYL